MIESNDESDVSKPLPATSDVAAMTTPVAEEVEALWEEYDSKYAALRQAIYDPESPIAWDARWQDVLNETGSIKFPQDVLNGPESMQELILMRAYAAMLCKVDDGTAQQIISHLRRLTASDIPHIAAGAHHLLGRYVLQRATLPDITNVDPVAIHISVAERREGITHYETLEPADAPHGHSIQLFGKADLPSSTHDQAISANLPKGAEAAPVTKIGKPYRLIGTGYEGIAAALILTGEDEKACDDLRKSMEAYALWKEQNEELEDSYNFVNMQLAECATQGLIANLRERGTWQKRDDDQEYSREAIMSDAAVFDEQINKMQLSGAITASKAAEWHGCVLAAKSMTENSVVFMEELMNQIREFLDQRIREKGSATTAVDVLRHDCIYALVLKLYGTEDQKKQFAALFA